MARSDGDDRPINQHPAIPAALRQAVARRYPTQKDCAQALGISTAFLCGLVHGKRRAPAWILDALRVSADGTHRQVLPYRPATPFTRETSAHVAL